MNCSNCGSTYSEGSKFCSQCGTALNNVCLSCGKQLSSNDQYCWNCGASITSSKQSQQGSQTVSKGLFKAQYYISIFFLIALIATISFCISERLDEVELLMNSLVALSIGLGGGYFLNKKWFTKLPSLGVLLVFSGITLFFYGFICSYISWGSYGVDWDDYKANFWAGLIIIFIGIVVYVVSYKDSGKYTSYLPNTRNMDQDCTQSSHTEPTITENEPSTKTITSLDPLIKSTSMKVEVKEDRVHWNTIETGGNLDTPINPPSMKVEVKNDKVHWNTIIDGRPYRYATYTSYIGIWIGVLVVIFQILFLMEFTAIWLLLIPSVILMIIAGYGLAGFKHYAYLCLMTSFWISLLSNIVLLALTVSFTDDTLTLSHIFNSTIQILFIIYFYKRREAYNK